MGRLAPHFLAVINLNRDAKGLVRAGHERVLRARFADAKFFWEVDQKCRLADYLPKLASVTFQAKLGSYGDKVERVRALSRWLAEQWFARGIHEARVADADRAAELAKCDFVTDMVREFTELQGIVGGLYAKAQGEPEEVYWAVYDHYRPIGLDEPTPRNLTGATVAIADKLDTLVGCFAVGLSPTGSSDPFGLRRAALGIVKIILERKLPLSLSESISAAARGLFGYAPKLKVTLKRRNRFSIFSSIAHVIFSSNAMALPMTKSTRCSLRAPTIWWMRASASRRCAKFARRETSSRWRSPSSASARFWRKRDAKEVAPSRRASGAISRRS